MSQQDQRTITPVLIEFHEILHNQKGATLVTVRAEDLQTLLREHSEEADEVLRLLKKWEPEE